MNSPKTEKPAPEREKINITAEHLSSKDWGPEKDSNAASSQAWAERPPEVCLPGVVLNSYQHPTAPGIVDPLSYWSHYPYQSDQGWLPYPNYFPETQSGQYPLQPRRVPGPPETSRHILDDVPGFTNVRCSRTPGVCDVSGVGQSVSVHPADPGPMITTSESETAQRVNDPTPGKGVLGTPSQYHQTVSPLNESRDQRGNIQAGSVGTFYKSKSRRPCHCKRSLCLKLYCQCFANDVMCSNCDCSNCHNNPEHDMKRQMAIKSCLDRNPDAFSPRTAGGESGGVKGCTCRHSYCLMKYCDCNKANVMCTSSCKCVSCGNYDRNSKVFPKRRDTDVHVRRCVSVEAVCESLLEQAQRAEMEHQSPAQAECIILEEFGHNLTQMMKSKFNTQ